MTLARCNGKRLVGAVFLLIATGCGSGVQPVKGNVAYPDGTPLEGGGQVTFEPIDPEMKTSARGIIKGDDQIQRRLARQPHMA